MSPISLFVLLCLGPLAVRCIRPRVFPPVVVPRAAQQCTERIPNSVGECSNYADGLGVSAPANENPCRTLKCAVPDGQGRYLKYAIRTPQIGTVCGLLKVCNSNKRCVDISEDEAPIETGIASKFHCYTMRRPSKDENNPSAKARKNGWIFH